MNVHLTCMAVNKSVTTQLDHFSAVAIKDSPLPAMELPALISTNAEMAHTIASKPVRTL